MTDETAIGFVDTNILVYAFDRNDSPKKRVAERLIGHLIDQERFRVSAQVLQELFVTLTRKAKPPCPVDQALAILDDLAAWPVQSIDYSAVRAAGQLAQEASLSFWDALIVIAAARTGATVLFTEDLNHGQEILGVRIHNPFHQPETTDS